MTTKLIRNSTAEFLIFTGQSGEKSIEARYEEDTIWLSQKLYSFYLSLDVKKPAKAGFFALTASVTESLRTRLSRGMNSSINAL